MRNTAVILVLLFWSFALPSVASASPLSLYGPFDQTHNGERGNPPAEYREVLSGCGRGRYRDLETQQCRGPADLR